MYVRVDLRPSLMLRVVRIGFYAVCLASLAWVELGDSLRVAAALLIAGNFLRFMSSVSKHPHAILVIDGAPRLLFQDHVLEVELQEYVYCTPLLQVLHFKRRQLPRFCHVADRSYRGWYFFPRVTPDGEYCVVILPDSSSSHDRRRLRTLLHWQGVTVSEDDSRSSEAHSQI